MDLALSQKVQPVVGMDIGTGSIKCVEISRTKESFYLTRASLTPLANTNLESIDAALKTLVRSFPTPPKNVRISVSGPSVLVRRVKLPAMTANELKSAIRFEAEGHIPFPVDECVLEYQILGNNSQDRTMNVLLAVAKKALVQERLKLLGSLDIKPELIDIDVLCLANAFEMLSDAPADKCYGLLDIGQTTSAFAIMHDKKPFFVREIACAGTHVTKALAAIKGIELDAAEAVKKQRAPESLGDLKAATQKGFESLAKELTQSISYFENEMEEDLKSIWLSGGGALSEDAPGILSAALGKNVAVWDNKKKIQATGGVDANFLNANAIFFNTALGLALRPLR